MLIKGLQKLTLLDYPEKMACTVFTAGCNFRCPFCHNASLVLGENDGIVTEREFFDFLKKRQGVLEGVCITGGEPTLQPDIDGFIQRIKQLGFLVKLDTNGYRPDVLKRLVEFGLVDYVAMDIKNCPEKYAVTAGCEKFDIELISESVDFLLSGAVDYEFRTTVVKELHAPQDIEKIGEWISGAKRYYLQCFEDSGDLISSGLGSYDKNTMQSLVKLIKPRITAIEIRGL